MGHKILAALIIILTVFWFLNTVLGVLADSIEVDIFNYKSRDVWHRHPTQVTPDSYTFWIWSLIFGYLLASYLFLVVCIFKTSSYGFGKTFRSPEVFNTPVAGIMILNSILYTAWLFVWDREHLMAATIIMFAIMGTNWIALGLFSFNLYDARQDFRQYPVLLNCYRVLLQNSIALYTAWTTVTALLSLSVTLVYDANADDPQASIIALSILAVLLLVWIPLDISILDKYTRYMVTPLFVVIWALVGIFMRVKDIDYADATPEHFMMGLTGAIVVILIARVVLMIYRAVKFPLK